MAATGIEVRHGRGCRSRNGGDCNCDPLFRAWVFDRKFVVKDADGNIVRKGKKIRKSFPTLAAARGWRIDALKAVRDKRLRAVEPKTLQEEVEDWLAKARSGEIHSKRKQPFKSGVVRNYELALRLRVLPELGDRRLDDIEYHDLLELKERLQGEGVSGSTIRNTFVPLQAIYRRARRMGAVTINPTVDLDLPSAGVRDRAATPQQAAELLEPLAELERAIWAAAFYSGLRRGELRALRARDIDVDTGTIQVEHGWDDVDGPIEPKSKAGKRTVFLLEALNPFLEPRLAGKDPDALVFGYSASTPFEPRAIARKAARAWKLVNEKRAGDELDPLTIFSLHEARHSFSTWMDHAGVSPDRADRYMGHSSGSVASRYRHLLPKQMGEDAKKIDAYLAGAIEGKVVPIAAAQ